MSASQDTLTSLASDTGGRAFLDTNDFGEAFARVQRDMSAYYLLGYASTNMAEGWTVPPYSGQGPQARTSCRGAGRLLRGPRLCAHEQDGPRGAAPGTVAVRRVRHRSAGDGCVRLLPPGGRSILRAARRRRARIRRADAARQGQGQAGARRARPRGRRAGTTRRPHSADAAAAARIGRQPRRRIRFCISRA